jgi:hypothetical protein
MLYTVLAVPKIEDAVSDEKGSAVLSKIRNSSRTDDDAPMYFMDVFRSLGPPSAGISTAAPAATAGQTELPFAKQ